MPSPEIFDPCNDFFSLAEISDVRLNLKKGVGSRGINNEHIRKIKSSTLDFLFQMIFNICFYLCYWPLEWRSATIFALIKGGVRNAWDPFDYRGISIVDTIGKFFESLVYSRLKTICLPQITEVQSGGLARNGSIQQVIRVVEEVDSLLNITVTREGGMFLSILLC